MLIFYYKDEKKFFRDLKLAQYKLQHQSVLSIRCNAGNSSFVQCQLGNPYMTGRSDVISITLDVSKISVSTKEVVNYFVFCLWKFV